MKLLLTLFIFSFSQSLFASESLLTKWKTCEESWKKMNPDDYEVFRIEDLSMMRLSRSVSTQQGSDTAPTFYFTDGKDSYVIEYPVEGIFYWDKKRFNFAIGESQYCVEYKCNTLLADEISFTEVLRAENCPNSKTIPLQKITGKPEEANVIRAYEKRFVNSIGRDLYALEHGKGNPEYTQRAYERLKKWNSKACAGLSSTLNRVIKDIPAGVRAHAARMNPAAPLKKSDDSQSVQ
ncbi:MAG: hypothetical protein BroJett040_24210 [Oligoflexia bacterium]|nr:MAG: hypothetical protein BroJett040_24210 [Oligoflexia bacterium]